MGDMFCDKVLKEFNQVAKQPHEILSVDAKLPSNLKQNLKELYDSSKSQEQSVRSVASNALPELIIKNFDLEQIWQQLELQNDDILSNSVQRVSRLLVSKEKLIFDELKNQFGEQIDEAQTSHEDVEESTEEDEENETPDDLDDLQSEKDDDLNENNSRETASKKKTKSSEVDDDFFKLDEMNKFLLSEEKKLENPIIKDADESDASNSDEEDVDFFKGDDNDENSDDDARMVRFKDYFVEKDSSDKTQFKRNKFLEDLTDNEEDIVEQPKSGLELRQERLTRRIEELEANAISEKPWQLKGEITAANRPQNSLLEEYVDFNLTSRPAPVITEHSNLQLEDIIISRIKNKVFDSVQRKERPVENLLEYKKKLVLDQEKSKHSLAQIYEKEFLDQTEALDPDNARKEEEEPELHKEVKNMMKQLFHQLDALSNFHFTPKPAIPELKIVSNLPALAVEEVAPVATSYATMLAPEELLNRPKGDIIGKGERTKTDKKRERRKKKTKQKIHLQEKAKRDKAKNNTKIGVPTKYKNNKDVDKNSKNKTKSAKSRTV